MIKPRRRKKKGVRAFGWRAVDVATGEKGNQKRAGGPLKEKKVKQAWGGAWLRSCSVEGKRRREGKKGATGPRGRGKTACGTFKLRGLRERS